MSVPFVDLKKGYQAHREEIDAAIRSVVENTDFILGKSVAAFEEEFAAYCGAEFAVGVGSGLEAIKLGLRAMGIGPGDEVICPGHTFIATMLGVTGVGATPVLVDVERGSFNIDPSKIEAAITPKTKAIFPVHLYGQTAEMSAVLKIAARHGLEVVEDASQAHGAKYGEQRVGTFGKFAAFSLYPAKNLGAYGDGGILVTDDAAIAAKVRAVRNYGSAVKYHHEEMGENSRLDTLHAAILRVKLKYLDEGNVGRRRAADWYREALADVKWLELPQVKAGRDHVYHLFVVRCDKRDALRDYLVAQNVGTVIHYPVPVHKQPCYARGGLRISGDLTVTEEVADRILSLPMFPEITRGQIDSVAQAVRSFKI